MGARLGGLPVRLRAFIGALLVAIALLSAGLVLTYVPPADADQRSHPAPGLLPKDCRDAGLFVVFGDEYPKQPGQNFWENGFICVEHVNP